MEEDNILHLASLKVTASEFKTYMYKGKAVFDFEYLQADWLSEEDVKLIGESLREIADIYKEALKRKYEHSEEGGE